MKKFFNEFKTFISRGNVMDMAIGVVIATAFGKISASLVADIIMPLIGCLIGGVDLATLNITLKPAVMDGETVVSEAVVLGLGTFLTTIIDFILIAFVVFLVVKAMNVAKAKLEKPAEPEPEKVFDMVEQMPTFPGGQQELMSYLGKNIKYPTIAQENGTQGRVIIQFVVERDGSITDVRVARGVDPYLDKEAVRVVKSMPKWIPGKQNGKAVRVKFTVPVMFRLQ